MNIDNNIITKKELVNSIEDYNKTFANQLNERTRSFLEHVNKNVVGYALNDTKPGDTVIWSNVKNTPVKEKVYFNNNLDQDSKPKRSFDDQIRERINNKEKYENYLYFYDFIVDLNYKCEDIWSIDEDIDKRREIKKKLSNLIIETDDNKMIFDTISDLVTDLEIVDYDLMKQYGVHDNRIVKYLKSDPILKKEREEKEREEKENIV